MNKSDIFKNYSLIGAICLTILALQVLLILTDGIFNSGYVFISMDDIIILMIYSSMAIALFFKNKKLMIVALGIGLCFSIYDIYKCIYVYNISEIYLLYYFLYFITYLITIVLIVCAIKKKSIVKKIWFLPVASILLFHLFSWNIFHAFEYIENAWDDILIDFIHILAYFFLGMWIKEDVVSKKASNENKNATINSQAVTFAMNSINISDNLSLKQHLLSQLKQRNDEAQEKIDDLQFSIDYEYLSASSIKDSVLGNTAKNACYDRAKLKKSKQNAIKEKNAWISEMLSKYKA